jgi:hypothetical protein
MPEAGSDESIATSLTRKLQQCVQS